MKILVDELVINYSLSKAKKMVLLLHGWGDSLNGLNVLSDALKKRGYGVISLDLPGFGSSDNPKSAWGLNEYARFIDEFLKKVKISPFAVIGHSNGGAIALKANSIGLIKPAKLVLIASAGIRSNYNVRNKTIRLVAKLGKLLTQVLPRGVRKKIRRAFYDKIGSDLLIKEDLIETFKKIVSEDLSQQAKSVTASTLLIYGDKDVATPVAYGKIFEESIKGSKLVIIPGAGHFIHLDYPDKIIKEVIGFLNV